MTKWLRHPTPSLHPLLVFLPPHLPHHLIKKLAWDVSWTALCCPGCLFSLTFCCNLHWDHLVLRASQTTQAVEQEGTGKTLKDFNTLYNGACIMKYGQYCQSYRLSMWCSHVLLNWLYILWTKECTRNGNWWTFKYLAWLYFLMSWFVVAAVLYFFVQHIVLHPVIWSRVLWMQIFTTWSSCLN